MDEKLKDLNKLGFEVVHLGINAADHERAAAAAECFAVMFGWAVQVGKDSIFAGRGLEIMSGGGRGTYGHIGVAVADIHAAKRDLEDRGWMFAEDSAKYDDQGRLIVIYLRDEVAGFAVHLLQK